MRTRTIERSEWNSYLAKLSERYLNQLITIEVISSERGAQVVAERRPLLGIAPELKGSEATAVDIQVGREGTTDSYMHEVAHANLVMLEEDDAGTVRALDIEGEDASTHTPEKTIVTFHLATPAQEQPAPSGA